MSFQDMGLNPTILKTLETLGYETPTPIQEQAIPLIREGGDVLGLAQTGTGKTAAFALPLLDRLAAGEARGPRILVLAPTRELAGQVHESFQTYGKSLGLKSTVIFGGVRQRGQESALRRGVDVIVATPGRFIDLYDQGLVNLKDIETFVLDEADRMLDMGFIDPIRKVAGNLPRDRQTLMFSATMPRMVKNLADTLLRNPTSVAVTPETKTAPSIEQKVYFLKRAAKPIVLEHILTQPETERVIVFTSTKRGADRVRNQLRHSPVKAVAIHGDKSQGARRQALDSFKAGKVQVLVATDVAARGIDVDGVSHVINYDLPTDAESYVHRIGRTGRAGAKGLAVALCDDSEHALLRTIERSTKSKLEVLMDHPMAEPADLYKRTCANLRSSRGRPSGGRGRRVHRRSY